LALQPKVEDVMIAILLAGLLGADPGPCLDWIAQRELRAEHEESFHEVSASLACFDGTIQSDGSEPLIAWAERAGLEGERKHFVVRSSGGDVATALDVVERLQPHQAVSTIVDFCGSSCANYFYAAIADRRIEGEAVVGFHGGLSEALLQRARDGFDDDMEPYRDQIEDLDEVRQRMDAEFIETMSRQDALLAAVGADDAIIHRLQDFIPPEDGAHCHGPEGAPLAFQHFDPGQAEALGIAPAEGVMLSEGPAIEAALERMGLTFRICRAPDAVLQPAD
jgi:ATP-dependent protease ClpP protease subunit